MGKSSASRSPSRSARKSSVMTPSLGLTPGFAKLDAFVMVLNCVLFVFMTDQAIDLFFTEKALAPSTRVYYTFLMRCSGMFVLVWAALLCQRPTIPSAQANATAHFGWTVFFLYSVTEGRLHLADIGVAKGPLQLLMLYNFVMAFNFYRLSNAQREIAHVGAKTWWYSSEGVLVYPMADKLVGPLRDLGITPNFITIANIPVGTYMAWTVATSQWQSAFFLCYVHQLLDGMDGTMARRFNMGTPMGAVLDEYCDIICGIILGIASLWRAWPHPECTVVIVFYCTISLMGELAWSTRDPKKRIVRELRTLEFIGLLGLEFMSYILWSLLCMFAYVDTVGSQAGGHSSKHAEGVGDLGNVLDSVLKQVGIEKTAVDPMLLAYAFMVGGMLSAVFYTLRMKQVL